MKTDCADSMKYIGESGFIKIEEVVELLKQLVECESTSGKELECGQLIQKIGKKEGLVVETIPCTENRYNVILTWGATSYKDKRLGLLLHGHYDTVPSLDMEQPFVASVENGCMRGRGVTDQKSGLAASIAALIAIKRSGKALKKPVSVAAVIDEESEHRGSYALKDTGIRADYGIVTEPTDGECDFGCLGTTPICITVTGRTAHASNPGRGINAIEKSMPILQRLFALHFEEQDLGSLGTCRGTLCVSKMEAGSAYNNVPGQAVIWVDRRTVPGESSEFALRQVQEIIEEVKKKQPDLVAEAKIARPDWHWEPIAKRGLNPTIVDERVPLYDILNHAAAQNGMPSLKKGFFWGYNDMDFLVNDLKIPTVVIGPGDGSLAHGPKESVSLNQMCTIAEMFAETIEKLCM